MLVLLGNMMVIAVLAVAAALAVRSLWKSHRSGVGGILAGYPVPSGAGQDDTPPAPERHPAGRTSYPTEADHHAGAGRHPP